MSVHYIYKLYTKGEHGLLLCTETRTSPSLKLEVSDTYIFIIRIAGSHTSEARNFREVNLVRTRTQRKSPRVIIHC